MAQVEAGAGAGLGGEEVGPAAGPKGIVVAGSGGKQEEGAIAPVRNLRRFRSQREQWDCGPTCVANVLQWVRGSTAGDPGAVAAGEREARVEGEERGEGEEGDHEIVALAQDIAEAVDTNSVWTVDLFKFMLTAPAWRDLVQVEMHTTNAGVRPEYSAMTYYEGDFSADERRVLQIFEEAKAQDWPLTESAEAIAVDTMGAHVMENGAVAIVLVDARLLQDVPDDAAKQNAESADDEPEGYVGHYVVLCELAPWPLAGADSPVDTGGGARVKIADPSPYRPEFRWITLSSFEAARHAAGTDDDVIIVIPVSATAAQTR